MSKTYYFPLAKLHQYIIDYFVHWGVSASDAKLAADVLLAADQRGVDSHGMIRLSSYYGSRLRKGLIDPACPMTILRESPTTLSVDAGNGLGHPVSVKTMQQVITKAELSGLAMATVRNSNHFGIAGYYAMMALPADMIGICFTNSAPLVAPTHGRQAVLGTNPIAAAVPAGSSRPFVLDMATSIVPIGRINVYQKEGKSIPSGWGVDSNGQITQDPAAVRDGGALLPLGGSELMRGYKGYGLSLMVDIFSGVLAGAAFSSHVGNATQDRVCDVGHFFAAIKIEAFREITGFKKDMDELLNLMRHSPKASGEERIYIHGEKEFENAERALDEGVPLSEATVKTLIAGGQTDGVPFDLKPTRVIEERTEN